MRVWDKGAYDLICGANYMYFAYKKSLPVIDAVEFDTTHGRILKPGDCITKFGHDHRSGCYASIHMLPGAYMKYLGQARYKDLDENSSGIAILFDSYRADGQKQLWGDDLFGTCLGYVGIYVGFYVLCDNVPMINTQYRAGRLFDLSVMELLEGSGA